MRSMWVFWVNKLTNKKTQKKSVLQNFLGSVRTLGVVRNLQVICPNCHAMTDTFMALNKGRSSRSKRYNK